MSRKTIKKKSKTKRNYSKNEKYPALNPLRQVYNRRDLIDMDYIDKLSDKEKKWLNAFLSETVVTNFDHTGKKLYKTKKMKRKLYKENNDRNVDTYNVARSSGKLYNYDISKNEIEAKQVDSLHSAEDVLIDLIFRRKDSED